MPLSRSTLLVFGLIDATSKATGLWSGACARMAVAERSRTKTTATVLRIVCLTPRIGRWPADNGVGGLNDIPRDQLLSRSAARGACGGRRARRAPGCCSSTSVVIRVSGDEKRAEEYQAQEKAIAQVIVPKL